MGKGGCFASEFIVIHYRRAVVGERFILARLRVQLCDDICEAPSPVLPFRPHLLGLKTPKYFRNVQ